MHKEENVQPDSLLDNDNFHNSSEIRPTSQQRGAKTPVTDPTPSRERYPDTW